MMNSDSTPHASAHGEANQAGSFHTYPKPPASFIQQVGHMARRGLTIPNVNAAAAWLSDVNYYRASGYWLTLLQPDGTFSHDSSFDTVRSIYAFDSELRMWLWSAIAPIEIKARTSFAYHLSVSTGSAMSYEDKRYFKDAHLHSKSLDIIRKERDRAYGEGVPCVVHNMNEYGMLPIWAAVEIMSMGTVSKMYGNLSDAATYPDGKRVRDAIAKDFSMSHIYLESWLRHLTYIRNLCAHHRRVYNRTITTRPKLLRADKKLLTHDSARNRLFASVTVIMRIYLSVWRDDWPRLAKNLISLTETYPDVDLAPIGFPREWRSIIETN